MRNALIAAIVAAVISAGGGYAAGITSADYEQNARLDKLEIKVACLRWNADHDQALLCMRYAMLGPR